VRVAAVWGEQFGWLVSTLKKSVMVGEWGGSCKGLDGITQNKLADWMIANCINDNFWWALNPGSEDTGGLFHPGWESYDERKMGLLDRVQPTPSQVLYLARSQRICIIPGARPKPACNGNRLVEAQEVAPLGEGYERVSIGDLRVLALI
jgi:hypothetical protein